MGGGCPLWGLCGARELEFRGVSDPSSDLVEAVRDSFGPAYLVRTLRPLAPLLERSGMVTADELGLDTLEARLRESCANGAPSVHGVNGGAWVRLRADPAFPQGSAAA
jgi:hypothetical protein